jgi:hypothetical protein
MTAAPSLCELVVRSPRPAPVEQWYREALGLTGVAGRLGAGAAAVRIERAPGLPARAGDPKRLMPNFVVDDADEVERTLIGMGVTWIRELAATPWGRIATVLDPDGSVVQIFELAPQEQEDPH